MHINIQVKRQLGVDLRIPKLMGYTREANYSLEVNSGVVRALKEQCIISDLIT